MRIEIAVAAVIVPLSLAAPAKAFQDTDTLRAVHVAEMPRRLVGPAAVHRGRAAESGEVGLFPIETASSQPFVGIASAVYTAPSPAVAIPASVNASPPAPAVIGADAGQAGAPDLVGAPTGREKGKKVPSTRDPLRPFNRVMWGFNRMTDRFMLKPVSTAYRAAVPKFMRRGVGNAFDNLSEPWSAVNNVLQAKPGRALDNVGRFAVNTTVGLGGLTDRATQSGYAGQMGVSGKRSRPGA